MNIELIEKELFDDTSLIPKYKKGVKGKQRKLTRKSITTAREYYIRKRLDVLIPTLGNIDEKQAVSQLKGVLKDEMSSIAQIAKSLAQDLRDDNEHIRLDVLPGVKRKDTGKINPGHHYQDFKRGRLKRIRFVHTIIWRAIAFQNDLKDETKRLILKEIVDRRLRLVERMRYHVAKAVDKKRKKHPPCCRKWVTPLAYDESWIEKNHPVHRFEYPRFAERSPYTSLIRLNPNDPSSLLKPGWSLNHGRYEHDDQLTPSAKDENDNPYWRSSFYHHYLTQAGKENPVQAIESLFHDDQEDIDYRTSDDYKLFDFKERNWLLCDQTIHALHLESLLFGRRRHVNGTDWLADLVSVSEKYVQIYTPLHFGEFPEEEDNSLLNNKYFLGADPNDDYFENIEIPLNDLQIGDHIVIWNHPIFQLVSARPWRLENALVVDIIGHGLAGLVVQGHGTLPRNYNAFLQKAILEKANERLAFLRKKVKDSWDDFVDHDKPIDQDPWNGARDLANLDRYLNTKLPYTIRIERDTALDTAIKTNFAHTGARPPNYAAFVVSWDHDSIVPTFWRNPERWKSQLESDKRVRTLQGVRKCFPLWDVTTFVLEDGQEILALKEVELTTEDFSGFWWVGQKRNEIDVIRPKVLPAN